MDGSTMDIDKLLCDLVGDLYQLLNQGEALSQCLDYYLGLKLDIDKFNANDPEQYAAYYVNEYKRQFEYCRAIVKNEKKAKEIVDASFKVLQNATNKTYKNFNAVNNVMDETINSLIFQHQIYQKDKPR